MAEPVLRKLRRFGDISQEDEAALLKILTRKEREVPAGTDLLVEGENPQYVHLIRSGFACRYKMLASGRRQIVAFLLPGDFCDLHSFVMSSSDHSIAAMAPSTIVEIPRQEIEEIMARASLVKPMMMSTLVDEAVLREWIANIGQRPSAKRIAHLFCETHARLKNVGLVLDDSFQFPVYQADLGDTVGLSTVHTNRAIKELREKQLVSIKNKTICIRNLPRLQMFCEFASNYLFLGGIDQGRR